ncbi:Zinc finger A20 and AN1 domain-containing stress-associated protein [Zostera marina]|uniref:Zinc finger A20 and AN1 domain-containing stress-associated protein n=1 Tax=Zostera marina TaxID=29655 RepID=A0A0K9NTW4_ZOSMR|nr:Zinc finger A20 and AN1 domain-containing stress-associated protein [Zostera marina]
MAEEQRCQAQSDGHRLCANNCGFFGSPATLNLCSKCFRDLCLKEEQASTAKIAVEQSLLASSSSTMSSPSASTISPPQILPVLPLAVAPTVESPSAVPPPQHPQQPSRCESCRKKVGLTGFRCRCGETFCGTHRYPERHNCCFDFKSVGKDAIARANPIVKAPKLDKI